MDTSFHHQIFSVSEAAQHLRVSRSYLYSLIAGKRVKPIKLGRRTVISGKELVRFIGAAEDGGV